MKKLFAIYIVTLSTLGAQSFSQSKKILLNEIYKDNRYKAVDYIKGRNLWQK